MKLFERYLMACTNQRIPMPNAWQTSLGLSLCATKQLVTSGQASVESTGYAFQQDDSIQRGFVNHVSRTKTRTKVNDYIMQLYLQAIKYHKGEDYSSYFLPSTTHYEFPHYVTETPVIMGEAYSIYGSTTLPVRVLLYSEVLGGVAQPVYDTEVCLGVTAKGCSMSSLRQYVVDTAQIYFEDSQFEGVEEYFVLRVVANVGVAIIPGQYNCLNLGAAPARQGFDAHTVVTDEPSVTYPAQLPSVAYTGRAYANKLIPALLGINITSNSSPATNALLPAALSGRSFEEKILLNTSGLHDVDKYLGGGFKW